MKKALGPNAGLATMKQGKTTRGGSTATCGNIEKVMRQGSTPDKTPQTGKLAKTMRQ